MTPATKAPSLSQNLRSVVTLSIPVIFAELGWMFMGVVDTIMVGRLGPTAIGAVSVGGIVFDVVAIFGIGLLLGLDTLVSQSWGANRPEECDRSLWQALYILLFVTPCLAIVSYSSPSILSAVGVNRQVSSVAEAYIYTLTWSLAPVLLYAAFRRYLQGMGFVKIVTFALVSANAVNAIGNYLLIPRWGVEGAGWATFGARVYMAAVLGGYAIARNPGLLRPARVEIDRIRRLLALGFPAASQILLEVGVFAVATMLAGRLTPESLAAHHIVLNIVGVTFMIPLGISSAGAVLVGQAIGAGDPAGAKRTGWLAIACGGVFMTCSAALLIVAPRLLLGIFSRDAAILSIATQLIATAAVFQIFDGVQVATTGVLRGTGNTRTPMVVNLLGHWLVGLPAGYVLCFSYGLGAFGLWIGLSIGLILVGSVLLYVWHKAALA